MTKPKAAKGETFRHVVLLPDAQAPFERRTTERAIIDYVRRTSPDELLHIGDLVDFTSIGQHRNRIPMAQRLSLQQEEALLSSKLDMWASLCYKGRRRFIPGNHEDRHARYLIDNAEQAAHLSSVQKIVEAAGWEYTGDYHEGSGCWVGKPDGLWAMHGNWVNKHSAYTAKKHFDEMGRSVVHGHTHRLGAYYRSYIDKTRERIYAGFEIGTMADPLKTPRSVGNVNWQQGFGIAWVSDTTKRFHVDLIAITDGKFVYGGQTYGG